jgi:hypothetical protein
MANGTIEQVQLPSGNIYDIVDAGARELIEALENYSAYLGVTTTPLTDGSTTNPIQIGGQSVTAKHGEIANYGSGEFIWNGNLSPAQWQEFGDLSALGDLAFKDTASGSFTPAGSVSQPTFTGDSNTCSVTVANNSSGNYTPAGTVSQPTFTGNSNTCSVSVAASSSGNYTPGGTVSQPTFSGTKVKIGATVKPTGTVSQPTFSGDSLTSTGTYTPAGSVTLNRTNKTATVAPASSGTATYTPAGTCSGTAVTLGTKTIQQVKTTGSPTQVTLPTVTVTNKVLTFTAGSVTACTAMTKEGVTVGSGSVSSVTQPTFTGTGVRLVTGNISVANTATFSGTEATLSVSGTPSGTVSQPTFTGNTNTCTVTAAADANGNYTPGGTVSQPSFTGTKVNIGATVTPTGTVSQPTFSGTKVKISATVTPTGTVSKPTFSGTAGTVTVS